MNEKKRTLKIYSIQLLAFTSDSFTIEVHCSKGTYIRTLVEDIARVLNTVAHVVLLQRLWVTPFQQQKCYSLEELTSTTELDRTLLPMDFAVQHLRKFILSSADAKKLKCGQPVQIAQLSQINTEKLVSLYTEDHIFLGVGEIDSNNQLCAKRLINLKISESELHLK